MWFERNSSVYQNVKQSSAFDVIVAAYLLNPLKAIIRMKMWQNSILGLQAGYRLNLM